MPGKGDDKAYGGTGDLLLKDGQGNDVLHGDQDDDLIKGGQGRQTCEAQEMTRSRAVKATMSFTVNLVTMFSLEVKERMSSRAVTATMS